MLMFLLGFCLRTNASDMFETTIPRSPLEGVNASDATFPVKQKLAWQSAFGRLLSQTCNLLWAAMP